MHKVGLIMKKENLISQLETLPVWGEKSGFYISAVYDSPADFFASESVTGSPLDLLIIGTEFVSEESMNTLQSIKEYSSGQIIFCGSSDFAAARIGILLGIADYMTAPLESACLLSIFKRIRGNFEIDSSQEEEYVSRLTGLFMGQEKELYEFIELISGLTGFSRIIDRTVAEVFETHEWLDLYLNEKDFTSENQSDLCEQKRLFTNLFESFVLLNPQHNDLLDNVIQYILYNPESDLRQKVLSEEQHINKSYLSTVFTAQTGYHFVDYITRVKLMRAAWLLKNTNLKISEIAGRIAYKDIAYFSKQFKKIFNISPSEYRIPDYYYFNI